MQIGMLANAPLCLVPPNGDQVAHRASVFRPPGRVMDRNAELPLQNTDQPPAELVRNHSADPNPALTLEMGAVDPDAQ
jgi:hypothetical protein